MAAKREKGVIELIAELRDEADKLAEQQARDAMRAGIKEGAQEVRNLYDAFVAVGFTEDQAFELLLISMNNIFGGNNNGE